MLLKKLTSHPIFPFAAPFALWMLFMILDGIHEHAVYATYPIKTLVVGLLILYCWKKYPSMKFKAPLQSIGIGIIGFIIWVGLFDYLPSYGIDQETSGFKPYETFEETQIALGLIVFRMLGAVLVVPIMEEVLWRGFVQRFIIKEDFEAVPLGQYTHASFWITTGLFVAAHVEVGVAFIVGALFGWWFIRTKTLGDVILAHAITNLALGIYVLYSQNWYFW
ncbi:MAG: CAAX prenyl protease-related protein [Verrucomicrobiota bacterium]